MARACRISLTGMTKLCIVLSVCVALAVMPRMARADNSSANDPLYKYLSYTASKGDTASVLATLDKALSEKKDDFTALTALVNWLSDNTYGQLDDSKIVAAYVLRLYDADYEMAQLYKASTGEQSSQYRQSTLDAFKALLSYELVAMTDAKRCQDPSVISVVASQLGPRYQNINYAYTFLNPNEIKFAWYSAMQFEDQKSDRPFNLTLCLKGDRAADPSHYNPVDVTPEQWADIRTKTRAKYKEFWESRYADAVRAGAHPAGAQ